MLTVLLAVYLSEYMLSLIIMDQSTYILSDIGQKLHYLKMPALAIGFLLFPLSRRIGSDVKARRILMLVSNIIYILGMASLVGQFGEMSLLSYVISCGVSLLSLGFLGGAVYYYYAMGLVNHPYLGRLSGLGGAAAFLIQMSAQYLIPVNIAMLILLLAGFAFTAYMTILSKDRFDWMYEEPLEFAKEGDPALPGAKVLAAGIVAMMLLYMVCGLTDTVLVSLNFAGDMGIYAWPRLFGAVGYIVGGILADIGRRKWMPLAAVCMIMLCVPLPFILSEGYTVAGTCLYYVIAVGQIGFLNIFFWEIAPRTKQPELWTGMSRVLSCFVGLIFPLFAGAPVAVDMVAEVLIISAVIICFALFGYIPSRRQERNDENAATDEAAYFEEFAEAHGLTPREKDFLAVLLESDDDVSVIAGKMDISTRTVYRHINSIYEKTGTETRYALMRYYFMKKSPDEEENDTSPAST